MTTRTSARDPHDPRSASRRTPRRRGGGRGAAPARAAALALLAAGCAPAARVDPLALPLPASGAAAMTAVDSSVVAMPLGAPGASGVAMLRIGPGDLLQVTIFESAEMSGAVRVDAAGRLSLPLLGQVAAGGLTPPELERRLVDTLRARYIRDPHVTVQVTEMQSRGVSVVGAVARPGVFQVREARPLLELLALAGGLAPNAGDRVIVVRTGTGGGTDAGARLDGTGADGGAAAPIALTVSVHALLESGSAQANVLVQPGDQVKVVPAGLAYVVGEVRRPGAFPLGRSGGLTVLRAIAMAEGLSGNAARGRTVVIRTDAAGARVQLPVNVGDVLSGRAADVSLQPEDVVFVPSSRMRAVTLGVVDALVRTVTLRGVF